MAILIPTPEKLDSGKLYYKISINDSSTGLQDLWQKISADSNYNSHDCVWEITVLTDQTITRSLPALATNFILKGDPSSVASVKIILSTFNAAAEDYTIFPFLSSAEYRGLKLLVQDLKFEPILNSSGKYVEFIKGNNAYLFRTDFYSQVTYRNITSFLVNGVISNVDVRTCDNITIDNCILTNYNAISKDVKDGCIIQLRGSMTNVIIRDCTFNKYGNDEVIGIHNDNLPYPSYLDPDNNKVVPFFDNATVIRRNILIENNTIEYKRVTGATSPQYDEAASGKPVRWDKCDRLFSFISVPGTIWQNVNVRNNTIKISYPVKTVFMLSDFDKSECIDGFRIYGNTITHSYVDRYAIVDGKPICSDQTYVLDFHIYNSASNSTLAPIEIFNNTVVAKEEIGANTNGHTFIEIDGANVLVYDNDVDATNFKSNAQAVGFTPVKTRNYDSSALMKNNTFRQVRLLASCENTPNVKLDFQGNKVFGDSRCYFRNVQESYLRLSGNYFKCSNWPLACQGFGTKAGSFWACENVYNTSEAAVNSTAVLFYDAPVSTNQIEFVVFNDNVIKGNRLLPNPLNDIPAKCAFTSAERNVNTK